MTTLGTCKDGKSGCFVSRKKVSLPIANRDPVQLAFDEVSLSLRKEERSKKIRPQSREPQGHRHFSEEDLAKIVPKAKEKTKESLSRDGNRARGKLH